MLLAVICIKAQNNDEDQIKKVIEESYLNGIIRMTDTVNIEKGFHASSIMFSLFTAKDSLKITKFSDWIKNVKRTKAQTGGVKKPERITCNFKSIDITGFVAAVKLEILLEGTIYFTDYLGLYRFKDGWKIVSKIFHAEPPDSK